MSFLQRLASLIFLCAALTVAQTPASVPGKLPFELKPIGPNIWAAIDNSSGEAGDDLVGIVLPELTQTYGSWDWFKDFFRSDILDVAAELSGSKRVPADDKK